jgi:hypothetical protein
MGRSFDAFWNLLRTISRHPPVVHYWLGSDVFRTVRDHAGGKLRTRVFESIMNDHHLADAPWLAEELAQVGIRSTVMHIPAPNLRSAEVTPLPEQFSVLTYIPDTRFAFYGGNSIYQAAANLPDIQFVVVGGNGRWARDPLPNLRFMGWQNDLTPFYQESSVVLRIVEHDSIGVTVKEALSFGRHVIYSYPLPHTLHVPFNHAAKLTSALNDLHTLHKRHLLLPNTSGWSYALQEFNEARDARQFAEYIHQIVKTGRS